MPSIAAVSRASDRRRAWVIRSVPMFPAAALDQLGPPALVALQRSIVEINTKIRLITRIAFGCRSARPSSPWPCSTSAGTAPPSPGRP